MKLSKQIRDLRYAKGWGPDDLASRARISRTALYQIESGKTELPHAATLRRIARALSVTPEELMHEPEADSPPRQDSAGAAPVGERPADEFVLAAAPPLLQALELERKFRVLLASPLRDGLARIVEEAYRLLPVEYQIEKRA